MHPQGLSANNTDPFESVAGITKYTFWVELLAFLHYDFQKHGNGQDLDFISRKCDRSLYEGDAGIVYSIMSNERRDSL